MTEPRLDRVPDHGPWTVQRDSEGHCGVGSDDFKHDVFLKVCGDFRDDESRKQYCEWLAAKLNAETAAADLLSACKAQHLAIDLLFAALVNETTKPPRVLRKMFYPSQSGQPWEALLQGNAAIAKAEGHAPRESAPA
jgi:hypothetical protein